MSHDPAHDPDRCHKEIAPDAPPLFHNGDLNFQVYHIGWIISGTFAIISTVVSAWLISKHLQWYTNKREQRYIIRLLFLVPIYALISFASFIFWNQATPLVLVRDAYEAIVLTAFFYLLLTYISPDVEQQRRIFLKKGLSKEADRAAVRRGDKPARWVWPLGFIKWKPKDGLYFLQLMKWAVLQYCVVRPVSTLCAVVLEYMGLYCETSWGLGWGHIWIVLIISISVTVAMYCLIQLYVPVSKELSPHRPLLKLFSVKAVVFLTFWQATFLSVLSMFGVVKDSKYMTAEDINIGIGALLETFEMMLFAFMHIKAFTYKPYKDLAIKLADGSEPVRTPQWRSLGHALDFRETFREIWVGWKYMWHKMRGREPKLDISAKRLSHYEAAFGRSRFQDLPEDEQKDLKPETEREEATLPSLPIEVGRQVEIEVEGQRQWLGLERDAKYYGIHPQREISEGLEAQIEQELARRGYPNFVGEGVDCEAKQKVQSPVRRNSWWRNLYNRVSGGQETEPSERESFIPQRSSRRSSRQRHQRDKNTIDDDLDDHPPRSILHPSKAHQEFGNMMNAPYDPTAYGMLPPSVQRPTHSSRASTSKQLNSSPPSHRALYPRVHINRSPPLQPQARDNYSGSSAVPRTNHAHPPSPRRFYEPPRDALIFPAPLSTVHVNPHLTSFHAEDGGTRQHLREQRIANPWQSEMSSPPSSPMSRYRQFSPQPALGIHYEDPASENRMSRNSIHRREVANPISPRLSYDLPPLSPSPRRVVISMPIPVTAGLPFTPDQDNPMLLQGYFSKASDR